MGNEIHCGKCGAEHTHVTVYKGDKVDRVLCYRCDIREQHDEYLKDGTLNTSLVTGAYIASEFDRGRWKSLERSDALTADEARVLREASDRLVQLATTVEEKVWFGKKLNAWVEASSYKGAHCDLPDGKTLLVYSMCGRCRLSLQDDSGAHFTIQCLEKESEPTMGVIGVCATLSEVEHFDIDRVRVDKNMLIRLTPNE